MPCPVCGGTDLTVINVRVSKDSEVMQVVGSTWDGRNMARCDDCGVLYDQQIAGPDGPEESTDQVNCPGCGSLNPGNRETCSHCGEQLDQQQTSDPWE